MNIRNIVLGIITFVTLLGNGTPVFASGTTKSLSENPVMVDWKFHPKVETSAGFNLDTNVMGLAGAASLDLEATIHKKAHYELGGGDTSVTYGYVRIKDLEIKIDTNRKKSDYDSTKTSTDPNKANYNNENTAPLMLAWGTIEGVIYIGPVYITLAHTEHDDQNFIQSALDDKDLSYSVVNYSIIPVYTTAQYGGNATKIDHTPYAPLPRSLPATISGFTRAGTTITGTKPTTDIKETFPSSNLGAASVGVKIPAGFDIRVGIATQYSYKQHVPENHNPVVMSLYGELLAIERLTVKLLGTLGTGANNQRALYDGNPAIIGALVGYSIPIGDLAMTPMLGAEVQFEHKQRVLNSTSINFNPGSSGTPTMPDKSSNTYIMTMPFQFALGLVLDWKHRGLDADEDDHFQLTNKDEKVTDGVSIAAIYGQTPHTIFRELNIPFFGVKLSLWESESVNAQGIIPNLKAGMIVNYNIAFGGTNVVQANDLYKDPKFNIAGDIKNVIGPRHDIGLGIEAEYTIAMLRPKLYVLFKAFDVLSGRDTLSSNGSIPVFAEYRDFGDNPSDLRVKLGVDVIRLVKNTTFQLWWESGDLLRDDTPEKTSYNRYDFYTNTDAAGNPSFVSNATLGYIAVGALIEY